MAKPIFDHQKRFSKHRNRNIILGIVGAILVIAASGIIVLHSFPALAANTADTVLRPVIGANATIAIESALFSVNDRLKQISYATGTKPTSDIFTSEPTPSNPTSPAPSTLNHKNELDLRPLTFHPGNFDALAGEGIWTAVALPQLGARIDIARTFVRPDPMRSYAIASLIQLNMNDLKLHAVAGTEQPGAPIGNPGSGMISSTDQATTRVVAAFNGGFQYKDGKYGMIVEGKTYVPLQPGLATLIIPVTGTPVIKRASDTRVKAGTDAIRQNGTMIVEHGVVTPETAVGSTALWGLTVTNSMYTWRSGIGITSAGNLIYAVGPSLTTATLASSLRAAGAVDAMQLDINPFWVRFVLFEPSAAGSYTYQSLVKEMQNGGFAYLHGYKKDFFYLTTNPSSR
jgi:hypothetical protein